MFRVYLFMAASEPAKCLYMRTVCFHAPMTCGCETQFYFGRYVDASLFVLHYSMHYVKLEVFAINGKN